MRQSRGSRDDYELIGKEVDMFSIELDPAVAQELRDFVAQDFLPRMMRIEPKKVSVPLCTAERDRTMFRRRFGRNTYSDAEDDLATFTGVSLSHDLPESWRLRAMTTRYRQDGTPNKIAVRHHLDMYDGRLFQARREVRIIRSNSDEVYAQAFFDNDQDSEPAAERLAFERPLTEDNISSLQQYLNSVAKRCITQV